MQNALPRVRDINVGAIQPGERRDGGCHDELPRRGKDQRAPRTMATAGTAATRSLVAADHVKPDTGA